MRDDTATYSSEFHELLANRTALRALIDGSCSPGTSWEDWIAFRSFIANYIRLPGSILDVGCANGFLLRCLQEWSENPLVPYGIDINRWAIRSARRLFTTYADHFVSLDVRNLHLLANKGLPLEYDYVLWNLWQSWALTERRTRKTLDSLRGLTPNGTLIVTLYGRSLFPLHSKGQRREQKQVWRRAHALCARMGSGHVASNPSGGSQALLVFEQDLCKQ